jgi:hypothetical protein
VVHVIAAAQIFEQLVLWLRNDKSSLLLVDHNHFFLKKILVVYLLVAPRCAALVCLSQSSFGPKIETGAKVKLKSKSHVTDVPT